MFFASRVCPSRNDVQVANVAVIVDTSGSATDEMLEEALGHIRAMLHTVKAWVTVLAADTEVWAAGRVTSALQAKQLLIGGGGTRMNEAIACVVKLRPRPDIIVALTDGLTPWPDTPLFMPVIAAIFQGGGDDSVPPWIKSV